ncbi:histone-lysine N-methyltransferases [Striga hermonthica]|uniref:Histone-lysine N-methyltransferases n=1 Tax=Striga hermonthica TaxID=68872 RepID=A0A9N7NQ99_STRHE|nr:histone-lysine N-methyltransferases [Striga hermonthica]
MDGQGNRANQAAQDLHALGPTFQQHSSASSALPPPPPHSHHVPFSRPLSISQHGNPSFHPTPGASPYQHGLPGFPHQGLPGPVASSGMIAAQVVQPSGRGHALERGHYNQLPSHAPLPGPPPLPLYPSTSSSSSLVSNPFGFSGNWKTTQLVGPLPPPPSLPPPLSLHMSNRTCKNEGSHSSKDLLDGNSLMLEHPPQAEPAADRHVQQTGVLCQNTENVGPKVESMDMVVSHSPSSSDMEMEDDITHPEEEKKDFLSISDGGCSSVSQEDVNKKVQISQHTGEHDIPEDTVGLNSFAESSVLKDQRRGSDVVSHSVADESGMKKCGQPELLLEASVEESSSQHKNSGQSSVPVFFGETGNRKLSSQLVEGTNSFNLLKGYASDENPENEGKNHLGDVKSPAHQCGPTNTDASEPCKFESKVGVESLSEPNKRAPLISVIERPSNIIEAAKLSCPAGLAGSSDEKYGGKKTVTTSAALESKERFRSYNVSISPDGAKTRKQGLKSNHTGSEVDEFGRLVKEGVGDSDTSDSPRYSRSHARRARRRSSSRSRSRSPHDRNRRSSSRSRSRSPHDRRRRRSSSRSRSRSPHDRRRRRSSSRSRSRSPHDRRRRRSSSRSRSRSPHDSRRRRSPWSRGRRDRSRSLSWSPRRRRSRSRTPVLRRDTERSGDKYKREKTTQLPEKCFDFLRGRCYRGASCRFSHSETNKSERSRNNRGKHLHDKESKVPQDMPGLRKDRDAKQMPIESSTRSPDKLNNLLSGSLSVGDVVASNLPGYSSYDIASGIEYSAKHPDKVPLTVDLQGKILCDSITKISESSALVQASSAHNPADKPDANKGPINQLLSVESPLIKTFSTEVQAQSLKELPTSIPSQSTLPLPPVSQATSAPFGQNYNLMQATAQFPSTLGNQTPYRAPVTNQHRHFPRPSNSLPNPFIPPPPRPLPPHYFSTNATYGENGNLLQHTQQPLQQPWTSLPSYASTMAQTTEVPNQTHFNQYQAYPLPLESNQMLHVTESISSSGLHVNNLSGLPVGPPVTGDRVTGYPMQGTNPSQSFSGAQPYSLTMNQPSYAHNFMGSGISNHFNPYGSTSDLPLGSKLESNASIQENGTTITTNYGAPVGSSSAPGRTSIVSKDMVSTSSKLPDESVLPRPGGDQYDPLFDSIEPVSTAFCGDDHKKHKASDGFDNMPKFDGSERVLNTEIIKQEVGITLSANDFIENEEFGETADVEVGDVLSGSLSTPNDGINENTVAFGTDQVETSKKKMKGKDSMKLFKNSIASFVKEVLKPSWRQGNMSKEAFKTIVKKTVDKVSGAMKGHRIPKSQANINHYIDSSRGKLTKLVMGYVDKYVKDPLLNVLVLGGRSNRGSLRSKPIMNEMDPNQV